MDALPPELHLYIVSFLPLTSLIAARGVNTQWRAFAQTTTLHPARKVLLNIYLAAIVHPNFSSLVAALQPCVREFDREAYIEDLRSRGCVLPDLFELWILEWPTKAVHFWAWPGLANQSAVHHEYFYEYFYDIGSLLGGAAPTIETLPVPKKGRKAATITDDGHPTCRGLALWQVYLWSAVGVARLWLVVDADVGMNDRRTGRLLWTYSDFVDGPEGSFHLGPKKVFYDTPFGPPTDFKLSNFLDLLDLNRDRIDDALEGYYMEGGVRQTDDDG